MVKSLVDAGMPYRKIQEIMSVSPASITNIVREFEANKDLVEYYKKNRSDILAHDQMLYRSYITPEKLEKASARELELMRAIAFDKERLERGGNKNGCFHRIIREIEKMDFINAPTETVDIKLPFDIHEKVEIMPGDIILIMGEVNSGKTALCLNIIKENMDKFEIHYFNSEMAGSSP